MSWRTVAQARKVAEAFSRRFQTRVESKPGDRVEFTPDTVSLFRADGSLVGVASREPPWFKPARKRAKGGEEKR